MNDFSLFIRWVFRDMFRMVRECMQSVSLGGVSFYDFMMSILVVFFAFKFVMTVYYKRDGGS